jgi:hypothetical protein
MGAEDNNSINIRRGSKMVVVYLILMYGTWNGLKTGYQHFLDDGEVFEKQNLKNETFIVAVGRDENKTTTGNKIEAIVGSKEASSETGGEYEMFPDDITSIPRIKKFLAKAKRKTIQAKPIPECLATTSNTRSSPTPVVLMSLGRSGSSVVWQVLSKLTGVPSRFQRSREWPGSDIPELLRFFDTNTNVSQKVGINKHIKSEQNLTMVPGLGHWQTSGKWLVSYMCAQRQRFVSQTNATTATTWLPNTEGAFSLSTPIVGMKWKPFWRPLWKRIEPLRTLQNIASMAMTASTETANRPPILIVRSRRNPIDVNLSRRKHKQENVSAHCKVGNTECIERQAGKTTNISDPKMFCHEVLETWYTENLFDELLEIVTAPSSLPVYISVSYDALFYPESDAAGEEAWNELVRFVSPHTPPLTWKTIKDSATMAATTITRKHADKIANWNEVYECLQGTPAEPLFRLDGR